MGGSSSSEVEAMRRVVAASKRSHELEDDDRAALLAGHLSSTERADLDTLELHAAALGAATATDQRAERIRLGADGLRTLRSLHPSPNDLVQEFDLPNCTDIGPPAFDIESPAVTTRNDTGQVIRSTRASASGRTLEVAAATGAFGLGRWPSSETFLLGFNRSSASIGGVLMIPAHADGAVLSVTVGFAVDQLVYGGGVIPGTGASLLATSQGDGDLPLRGTAVAWGRAGLSFHGEAGSARSSVEFVSSWVNRDGAQTQDGAPSGTFELTQLASLGASTSAVSVFIDVECFAGAEETEDPRSYSSFALFECRDKPVTEVTGLWLPASRLRVSGVSAKLCQLPVLLAPPRADGG